MKTLLLSVLVLFLAYSGRAFGGDITTGLAARWSFDGCSLADSSGSGFHGQRTTGTTCIPGVSGNGYYFDGKTGFIDVGDKNIISGGDTVTFIAWVNVEKNPPDPFQAIVTKWENSGGPQEWWFGLYNDAIHFTTQGYPCASYCSARMSKPLGFIGKCWTMVGVILTGGRVQYVLNGSIVDSDAGNVYSFSPRPTSVRIGRQNPDNRAVGHYNGGLDEIRIYKRALRPEDLLTLYDTYQMKVKVHYSFGDTPTMQPNSEVNFPLFVRSDDWAATPINDFTVDIMYRSDWHYIPNLQPNIVLTPGSVTPAGWTLTYSDALVDATFRKITIRGTGAIPLTQDGIAANLMIGTLSPNTLTHTSTVTAQTLSSQPGVCFTSDGIARTTTLADYDPPVISGGGGDCRSYSFEVSDPERIAVLTLDPNASDNVDWSFAPALPAARVKVTVTLRDASRSGKFRIVAMNSRGKSAAEERPVEGGTLLEVQSNGTDALRDTVVAGQLRCRAVELVNPGNDTVRISQLFLRRNVEISLPGGGRADVIPPNGRLAVMICYAPSYYGDIADTLIIETPCAALKRPVAIVAVPDALNGKERCEIVIFADKYGQTELPYPNPASSFVRVPVPSPAVGVWVEDELGNRVACAVETVSGEAVIHLGYVRAGWYAVVVASPRHRRAYPVFVIR